METQNDRRDTKYEIPFDFAQDGEQFGPELTAEGPVEPRTTNHHSRITTHQYLRLLAMALLLACFAAFTPKAWARYGGGTGDPNNPYRIATAENLNDIGNYEEDWDKQFVLINDVNLAQYTGTQFRIIGNNTTGMFRGVFDGNDHKVWSFTWGSTGRDYIGLFGWVGNGGQIKNLGLENADVNAVNGYYVGGLVGGNYFATITNCYSTGSASGNYGVGGLVGYCLQGMITNSYFSGSVLGSGYVGGLVGGNHWGTITNCYSTGSVLGDSQVGGLVGENYYGTITICYSTANVDGIEFVGGLVGYAVEGEAVNSFWDIETSYCNTSADGTGKTTVEMKTKSTFTDAGWDFVEIWGIGENQTYPFLRNEPAGDSNYDKKVDLIDLAILASHWLEEK